MEGFKIFPWYRPPINETLDLRPSLFKLLTFGEKLLLAENPQKRN